MTKNCFIVVGILLVFCKIGNAQVPIAYFDFESNAARNTTIETIIQESISGIGTPSISASSLTSSNGSGNGNSYGGSNDGYALGYYGFTTNGSTTSSDPHIKIGPFNCSGFASLTVSVDAMRTGSRGPDDLDVYWSLDDVTYNRITTSGSLSGSFNTRTFTVPSGADGASSLYFKLIGFNAGSPQLPSNATFKMDNFTLSASSITSSKTLINSASLGTGLSSGGLYEPLYSSLTVNGSSIIVSAASSLTFTGTLTLTNGQFSVGANTLAFQTADAPLARTSGTLTLGSSSNLVFGTTDDQAGAAFTIPANIFTSSPTVNNLTIYRDNDITWNAQGITIDGTLTLTDGNLIMGASTLSFENGATPIAKTNGKLNVSTSTNLSFGTNAAGFTIPSTLFTAVPSINNLTINRAGGITIGNQAFTINGTLTLTNGAFDILSTTLAFQTGNTPISRTSGTLTVGTGSSISFGTNATAFSIPDNTFTASPTITNLTINRAGGVTVGNQNFTIIGALTLTTGVFNALNTTLTFQTGNDPLARTSGTLTLGSSANLVFGTVGNTAGSAFEIPASIFTSAPSINNLTINRSNRLTWNAQDLTINGTLALTAGEFRINAITLSFQNGATPITRTSGTIDINSVSANISFGTQAAGFTIPNSLFSAAPSITNLTINRAGGITVGNQAFTINGTLNLANGAFDILNTALVLQTGATPIARTSGTLTAGATSSITFGTNASAFIIPDNTFTGAPSIAGLTINRAGGITLGNQSFTLSGTLALTSGALAVGANTLTFHTSNTPISRSAGTLALSSSSNLVFGTAGNTGGNAFTIPNSAFTTAPSLNNLTVNRTNQLTLGNQSITLNGTLTLTAGTFSIANNTLTLQNADVPLARTSGTLTVGTSANLVFGTTGNTGGAAFTLPNSFFTASPPSFQHFTINRTNTLTLGNQDLTMDGDLNLTAGTLDNAGRTINLTNANITGTGTETGTGYIIMTGNGGVSVSGATISNLQLNHSNGFSQTGSLTITNNLTLTAGALSVGSNTLTFHSGNTPITRTSGTITVSSSSNIVFGTNGNTGGNAFTIPASIFTATPPSFSSFTINRINSLTLNATQGLTLAGNLNLAAGTLDNAGRAISVAGNITGTGTETGAGIITMSTSAATISGATISNLALNNAGGFSLTGSPTITSTLNLTNGALAVGANTLTFHTGNTPIARTSGTINMATTSSLVFGSIGNTGGNAFTIPASTFTSAPEFVNFSINRTNSLTLNSQNFTVSGLLSITAGQLVLPASHTFTLRSTSITNTALVDVIGATGSISYGAGAAFRVERFIPQTGMGIRAYRDISPSVNTGTRRIFDTWQEGGTNGLANGVYYGTQITGVVGGSSGIDASTGLDLTASGAQSLFSSSISLVNGSDAFAAITSTNQTNDTLSALKGYRILLRGNRLVNLYQTPQPTVMNAPAILRSTGTLITGQVTFTTTGTTANGGTNTGIRLNSASATGFTMIGNPYASPVIWDSVAANSTSIQPTYWLFDPNIGTGSYVTYNTLSGCSNIASSANKYIQPGQAIFVRNSTLSPTPQLVFKETFKAPNTANLTGIYREPYKPISKINITIKKPITGRGIATVDGTAVAYDNSFSNSIGLEDGNKISNGSENIAVMSNGVTLSIEGRKNPVITDTIRLRLWQVTPGVAYQLDINTNDFVDYSYGLKPYLLDRFTNTETELLIKGIKNYSFVTTADTNSYNYRFKIVFRSNFISLPINFTSIRASALNRGVNVEWSSIESSIKQYQVQRSPDGMHFTSIGTVNAKGNGNGSTQQYAWHDALPLNMGYYRIQSTDLSGSIAYSNIVSINLNNKAGISIYPNPIIERNIRLQFTAMGNGDYTIVLCNLAGQSVLNNKINVGLTTVSQTIQLPQSLPAGSYMLSVTKDNFSYKQQVIVQ
jgi:hypothetical protein